jgi:hypothetical protein
MRLRCRKKKRKNDNEKLKNKDFRDQLGLLAREQFCKYRDEHGQSRGTGATGTSHVRSMARAKIEIESLIFRHLWHSLVSKDFSGDDGLARRGSADAKEYMASSVMRVFPQNFIVPWMNLPSEAEKNDF